MTVGFKSLCLIYSIFKYLEVSVHVSSQFTVRMVLALAAKDIPRWTNLVTNHCDVFVIFVTFMRIFHSILFEESVGGQREFYCHAYIINSLQIIRPP